MSELDSGSDADTELVSGERYDGIGAGATSQQRESGFQPGVVRFIGLEDDDSPGVTGAESGGEVGQVTVKPAAGAHIDTVFGKLFRWTKGRRRGYEPCKMKDERDNLVVNRDPKNHDAVSRILNIYI